MLANNSHIIRRVVSGKIRGLRLYVDGLFVGVVPTSSIVLSSAKSVTVEGVLNPPRRGAYRFIVDAVNASITLSIEGHEIPLHRDETGRLLISSPVRLLETGHYMLSLRATKTAMGALRLVLLLEAPGNVECDVSQYSYAWRHTYIDVLGVEDSDLVELKSVGTIASTKPVNGLARLNLEGIKPPIEACLAVRRRNGTIEEVGCLNDLWHGDVYIVI